jgi:Flagellar hook-length control protein FliK
VHALIALAGARAAVTLWAEREASAAHLRANGAQLQDALRAAALEPRDIQVRVGTPAAPPPAAGRFLDRAS